MVRRPWTPGMRLLAGGLVGVLSLFGFDLPEAVGGPVAWSLYWLCLAAILGALAVLGTRERTPAEIASAAIVVAVGWALGWLAAFLVAFMVLGGEAT